MAEHLLDAAQVGAALEQVCRERVAEQVRVHALGLEPRLPGEPAQDQERAGPGEGAALRVQEELRSGAAVEVRAAAGEVAAQRLDGVAADRHDALLVALADAADEPLVEVDAGALEADRLAHAEAARRRAARRARVAERARRRAGGRLDQPLRLGGGERPRQLAAAARKLELRGGVVGARAEQHLVREEGAHGGDPARDRRGREAVGPELGEVALAGRPGSRARADRRASRRAPGDRGGTRRRFAARAAPRAVRGSLDLGIGRWQVGPRGIHRTFFLRLAGAYACRRVRRPWP